MSERDELAEVMVGQHVGDGYYTATVGWYEAREMADDLIAAGYRKPRTITTAAELDELPFEAVIRDAEGHVLERWGEPEENVWTTVMVNAFIPRGDIALPVTVLHDPEATV